MKIGLIIPNILAVKRFDDRVFAPKELILTVADELVLRGHEVYLYAPQHIETKAHLVSFPSQLENNIFPSQKDLYKPQLLQNNLTYIRNQIEYELFITSKSLVDANNRSLDILHNYLDTFNHYFESFARMPILHTIHDPVFDLYLLESLRYKMFNHHNYLTISNYQKQSYTKNFQLTHIYMVHHGIQLDDFPFFDNSEGYLCSIGRYLPVKGIDDAVSVAIELRKNIVIASEDVLKSTEYYKTKIEPYINNPFVKEEKFLKPLQRNQVVGKAKAFLFPIKWEEPFGMVMIESMAGGTPIIAYAKGSVPEIVKDGETGFIVNSSEDDIRGEFIIKKTGIEGFKEAVEKIYTMPEDQYKKMRKNCRAHVEKNFTVERMVGNYEKVYEQVVSERKKM